MVPAGAERGHPGRGRHPRRGRPVTGTRPARRPSGGAAARRPRKGEELLPAGTPVDPGVHRPRRRPAATTRCAVPPDAAGGAASSSATSCSPPGPPGAGRVRDALGPQRARLAAPARRARSPGATSRGPVADTLDAHVDGDPDGAGRAPTSSAPPAAPCTARSTTCTRRWPQLGAEYVVNTVAVRPGFPMLLARVPGPDGRGRVRRRACPATRSRPSSRWSRWSRRCSPACAAGRRRRCRRSRSASTVPGRGDYTHLALVRLDARRAPPTRCAHVGSAMLRGLAPAPTASP